MPRVRVNCFTVSLDGYTAGPGQDADHPVGVGAEHLHDWIHATRTFCQAFGWPGGEEGVDDTFAARGQANVGATIMGRNMFGPPRGPWDGEDWEGWWGEDPPFHHPVFVLTHHPRPSIELKGGTTFHFVTDGIDAALARARAAAGDRDVRLGGGAATIQQFLRAGLIDELHLAIVPVLLGRGERLFERLDGGPAGYECVELVASPAVVHVRFERRDASRS